MIRFISLLLFTAVNFTSFSQENQITKFIGDSNMVHSSVSLYVIDSDSGQVLAQINPDKSLPQASILKLVTTAVALEKLGPDHRFKTTVLYSGKIRKGSGTLEGDIFIRGGGDPALGSENFSGSYNSFIDKWIQDIQALGIRKISGRIISDDSYFDFEPIPSGWGWDDIGNYYGSGAYGISVYDNTLKIHYRTSEKGTIPVVTGVLPESAGIGLTNYLTASGNSDNGYIYSAPYSNSGWVSGTIPENKEDFILKGSIPDPPLFLARTLHNKLMAKGIKTKGDPATLRSEPELKKDNLKLITETTSPPLDSIITILNHKSVNLYAEHLIKELGKKYKNAGTTTAGAEVIKEFLDSIGIRTEGMFIADGSGLSSLDAVNAHSMVELLLYMKNHGKYFTSFYNSLPEPGKEGTLKNVFRDPVFETRFRAKSGSLTRVRSYAGYFTTISGRQLIFCIIVNNYNGPSGKIISGIEDIIKELIIKN